MRKLNLAEGALVLLGFLLILNGIIVKMSDFNMIPHLILMPSNSFVAANTCFILTLILDRFGKSEK